MTVHAQTPETTAADRRAPTPASSSTSSSRRAAITRGLSGAGFAAQEALLRPREAAPVQREVLPDNWREAAMMTEPEDEPEEPLVGEQVGDRVRATDHLAIETENPREAGVGVGLRQRTRDREAGDMSAVDGQGDASASGDRSEERSAMVTAGIDGQDPALGAALSGSAERRTEDGRTVTDEASGSLDLLEGSATLEARSTTRHRDGTTSSHGASGTASLSEHGLSGAEGEYTMRDRAGRSFRLRGGVEVEIESPVRQPDGRWRVDGTRTIEGSARLGQRSGRVSGHIQVGAEGERRFRRHFATEAAAREFYDNAHRLFGVAGVAQFDGMEDPSEARAMAVGDTATEEDTASIGGGATAEVAGGIEVGASFSFENGTRITVARQAGDEVDVTVRELHNASGGATLSAPLGGMGATRGAGAHRERTLRFDLSTPAGQAAYRAARAGNPPRGTAGRGWRQISTGEGERSSSGTSASALGITLGDTSEVSESRTTDASGQTVTSVTGTSTQTGSTVLPDWAARGVGLGAASQATSLTTTGAGGASISTEVSGHSAREEQRALGDFTGAPTHLEGVSGEGSSGTDEAGSWTVEADLSESQLQSFVGAVRAGRVRRSAAGAARAGAVDDLHQALRAANGLPAAERAMAERRAVAAFVAASGPNGVRAIREQIGERPRFDLALEGSDVFTGNAEIERRVSAIEQRAVARGADATAVLAEARELLVEQQTRLTRMQVPERFQGVPPELRQEQIGRVREVIARLRRVEERMAGAARTRRDVEAGETRAADETAQRGEAAGMSRIEDAVGPESREEAPDAGRAAVTRDAATMERVAQEARRVRERVRSERAVHLGGAGVHDRRPAIEALSGESGRYERAQTDYDAAEQSMARAGEARVRYRRLADQLDGTRGALDALGGQLARETRELTWEMARHYRAALAQYRSAFSLYRAIRGANAARRDLWGSAGEES